MHMSEEKKPLWLTTLTSKVNTLAEEFGLDDAGLERFRDFVVSVAKAQYVAGNSAGIHWARTGKNKSTAAA